MDSIRNLFGNRMTSEKTSPQNNESYDEDINRLKTNTPTTNYVYNRNRTISETSNCSVNSATDSAEPQHPPNTTKNCNKDSEPYFWIMWRS